jgi:hypothetical protein
MHEVPSGHRKEDYGIWEEFPHYGRKIVRVAETMIVIESINGRELRDHLSIVNGRRKENFPRPKCERGRIHPLAGE